MRRLVFVLGVLTLLLVAGPACRGEERGLYVINLDGTGLRRVAGEDAVFIGWLDQNVALVRYDEELEALDIDSGESRSLLGGRRFMDVRLSPDSQRIAYLSLSRDGTAALHVVESNGSDDRILAESGGLNWFSWSPDSEHLVYRLNSSNYVVDISGEEAAHYVADGGLPDWAPCQRILFEGSGGIYSTAPDGSGQTAFLGYARGAACDPTGEIMALGRSGSTELVPVDGGSSLGTLTASMVAAWAPDGSKLAAYRDYDDATLVIVDLETREEVNLVSTSAVRDCCWSVFWSPDSQWVAFSASEVTDLVRNERLLSSADSDLYVAKADGSEIRRLVRKPAWDYGSGWTPDGTRILMRTGDRPDGY